MDMEFMGRLILSVMIFAPGVVLLVTCGLVGIAIMLEKIGALADVSKGTLDAGKVDTLDEKKLPPSGVIDRLQEAVENEERETVLRDGTNN